MFFKDILGMIKIYFGVLKSKLVDLKNYNIKINSESIIGNIFYSCILFLISCIPVYFYIFFKWLFEPVTFWQNLVLFIVWCLFLGWEQIIIWIVVFGIILFTFEK